MKKAARWFCLIYSALFALGSLIGIAIAYTTKYGDRTGVGCNFYDALLYGLDCRGFVGAPIIELLVSMPLLVGQVSTAAFREPLMGLVVLPFWLPILATIYLGVKKVSAPRKAR